MRTAWALHRHKRLRYNTTTTKKKRHREEAGGGSAWLSRSGRKTPDSTIAVAKPFSLGEKRPTCPPSWTRTRTVLFILPCSDFTVAVDAIGASRPCPWRDEASQIIRHQRLTQPTRRAPSSELVAAATHYASPRTCALSSQTPTHPSQSPSSPPLPAPPRHSALCG